jgi:hypothetical protein
MNFNKREDRENIEKLNRLVQTAHRSKPYDLKKAEDIIEATKMATAEFIDITEYWGRLVEVDEAFDESLEYYEPAAWIKIGLKGDTENEEIEAARISLESAISSFRILMDRAEEKCITMWKVVFNCGDDKVINYFFDEVIHVEEGVLEKVFEDDMIELLDNMEYDGVIENSAQRFAAVLKERLLDLIP